MVKILLHDSKGIYTVLNYWIEVSTEKNEYDSKPITTN